MRRGARTGSRSLRWCAAGLAAGLAAASLVLPAPAVGASALTTAGAAGQPAAMAGTESVDATPSSEPSATGVSTPTAEPPGAPVLLTPSKYSTRQQHITARAGSSTASMTLTINRVFSRSRECTDGQLVDFGSVKLGGGVGTFELRSASASGETTSVSYEIRRLQFSWATCIIIDKSERRLYWVKDGVTVKTYRIAIGKRRTPTPNRVWKVGRKEITPARSVYGPRKLRLYWRIRTRTGYRYRFTSYAIHGTNQPWVIGTMASHGCIRLRNSDILGLYRRVPAGTIVQTKE